MLLFCANFSTASYWISDFVDFRIPTLTSCTINGHMFISHHCHVENECVCVRVYNDFVFFVVVVVFLSFRISHWKTVLQTVNLCSYTVGCLIWRKLMCELCVFLESIAGPYLISQNGVVDLKRNGIQ